MELIQTARPKQDATQDASAPCGANRRLGRIEALEMKKRQSGDWRSRVRVRVLPSQYNTPISVFVKGNFVKGKNRREKSGETTNETFFRDGVLFGTGSARWIGAV